MADYADDDLISLASSGNMPAPTPDPSPWASTIPADQDSADLISPTSIQERSTTTHKNTPQAPKAAFALRPELSRLKMVPAKDSFSDLANLMRVRPSYNLMPKPRANGSVGFSNGSMKIPECLATRNQTTSLEDFICNISESESLVNARAELPPQARLTGTQTSVTVRVHDLKDRPTVQSGERSEMSDYSKEKMDKLQDLFAQINSKGQVAYGDEVHTSLQPRSSPAPLHLVANEVDESAAQRSATPVEDVRSFAGTLNENEAIVRMTLTAWKSMTATLGDLKKEKAEASEKNALLLAKQMELEEEKLSLIASQASLKMNTQKIQSELQRKVHELMRQKEITDSEPGVLKAKSSVDKEENRKCEDNLASVKESQLVTANTVIERRNEDTAVTDTTIKQQEQEIKRLRANLRILRHELQTFLDRDIDLKTAVSKGEKKIRELEAECEKLGRDKDGCINTFDEREKTLRGILVEPEDRWQNEHKLVDDYRKQLEEATAEKVRLQHLVEDLESKAPTQKLQELEAKLHEKSTQADRLRKELREVNHRLQLTEEKIARASKQGASLRGGAHLVIPTSTHSLPPNVFPCVDCQVKNLNCDSLARCYNCANADKKCARWRCSMKHILGKCLDMPCQLVHDADGWIMTREPRPQW